MRDPFSTKVGLALGRQDEQQLVRQAACECGLVPVDLSSTLPTDWETAVRGLTLIVADQGWEEPKPLGLAEQEFRLVLRVLDAPVPGHPKVVGAWDEAWGLDRPLLAETVKTQLRHAGYTARTLAARHHAMLEEMHRSRRVFESISCGITLVDARLPGMPLVYVNPAFERLSGFSANEARGRNCRFLQGSDTDQPGLLEIRSAVYQQQEARVILRNYRKDGTLFWNELSIAPVRNLEGELRYFVGMQNDVTTQVEATQRLDYLANHDYLTGLANHGLLMKQLGAALLEARQTGENLAVLFFDIDNLRNVNDVLGHDAGDRLLQVVAGRLRAETRESEMIARLGGDEFIVVLAGRCDDRWPQRAVDRMMATIGEPVMLYEQPFHPAASVGMAVFPQDGDTAETLLKIADINMYAAKHSARQAMQNNEESLPDRGSER